MWFYKKLAVRAAAAKAEHVIIMQTAFSSFAAADQYFAEHGFTAAEVIGEQGRVSSAVSIASLAPGCFEWLLGNCGWPQPLPLPSEAGG